MVKMKTEKNLPFILIYIFRLRNRIKQDYKEARSSMAHKKKAFCCCCSTEKTSEAALSFFLTTRRVSPNGSRKHSHTCRESVCDVRALRADSALARAV